MIQDEMKIEAIVEPFLTLSVTNLNPAACILLSQIKFENDSKDDSYESFHVLPLRPYMKNVNGMCSKPLCHCDIYELFHKCHKAK
jgi:hypothetical protein